MKTGGSGQRGQHEGPAHRADARLRLGGTRSTWTSVEREVKVYEGTFLDYALKLHGTPRVYVEARV